MAYLSRKCISCKERSKRCAQSYHGKDETGRPICIDMYACDNYSCSVNFEWRRALGKNACAAQKTVRKNF